MTLSTAPLTGQNVPFSRLRRMLVMDAAVQAGVVGSSTAFKVTQRAAGANMSVDVAAGDVMIPVVTGLHAPNLAHGMSDATENVGFLVANATNPRIDQIVAVQDPAQTAMQLVYYSGVATAGATLDNRTGAAALPANAVRLADVLVPAASSSVVTANIRDRRPWAWGAKAGIVGNQGGNITTTSTSDVGASSHTSPRIEIGAGSLVKVTGAVNLAGSGGTTMARVRLAGQSNTYYTPYSGQVGTNNQTTPVAGIPFNNGVAGSYACSLLWLNNLGGTGTMQNNAQFSTVLLMEEVVGGLLENS